MNRRIIETQLQSSKQSAKVDGYADKIIKYIPSEIVGGWIALQGIAENIDSEGKITLLWGILIFLVILTFFYIQKATTDSKKKPAIKQTVFSVVAFMIWAFAIGGQPFESLTFYNSAYGSILMILYTVTLPLIPLNQD